MSKILEAIDKLAKQTYPPGWNNPAIRKFIETGDEGLLKSIPPFRDVWLGSLNDAMPDPADWTDEASRALRLARAKDLDSLPDYWLARYCRFERAQWQHFDAAIGVLKSNGFSEIDIRAKLMECDLWDAETLKPTPAGVLVLAGSDEEILAGLKEQEYIEWHLPSLLAHSQPDRLEEMLAGGLKFSEVSTYGRIARANPDRFAAYVFVVFEKQQGLRGWV